MGTKSRKNKARRKSVDPKGETNEHTKKSKSVTPYSFNPTPPRKSVKPSSNFSEDEQSGDTTETLYSETSYEDQIDTEKDISGKKRIANNNLQNKNNKKQKLENDTENNCCSQSSNDTTNDAMEHNESKPIIINTNNESSSSISIPNHCPISVANEPISTPATHSNVGNSVLGYRIGSKISNRSRSANKTNGSPTIVSSPEYNPKILDNSSTPVPPDNTTNSIPDSPVTIPTSIISYPMNDPMSNRISIPMYNSMNNNIPNNYIPTNNPYPMFNPTNPTNNLMNNSMAMDNPMNNSILNPIDDMDRSIPNTYANTYSPMNSTIPISEPNVLSTSNNLSTEENNTTDLVTLCKTIASLTSTVSLVLSTVNSIVTQGKENKESLVTVTNLVQSQCLPKIMSLNTLTATIESRQVKIEDNVAQLQQSLSSKYPQKLFYYDSSNTNEPKQTFTVYNKEEKAKVKRKIEDKQEEETNFLINDVNFNEEEDDGETSVDEESNSNSQDYSDSDTNRNRNKNHSGSRNRNRNRKTEKDTKESKDAAALQELKEYKIYYYLLAKSFGFPLPKILKRDTITNDSNYRIKTTTSTEFVTLSNCTAFDGTTILPKYKIARMAKQPISGKSVTTNPRYLITFDTVIVLLQVVYDRITNKKKDHSIPIDDKYLTKLSKHIARKKQEIAAIKKDKREAKTETDMSRLTKIETLCNLITGMCSLYDTFE